EFAQAKWPEIDFDLIEPDREVTPSASQRERAAEGQGIPKGGDGSGPIGRRGFGCGLDDYRGCRSTRGVIDLQILPEVKL
ncbi:hypothetical protein U1Q18_049011, partial [Sarracenia purpurea var. burkii]